MLVDSKQLLRNHGSQISKVVQQARDTRSRAFGAIGDGVEASVTPVLRRLVGEPEEARHRLRWTGPYETGGVLHFDRTGSPLSHGRAA